MKRGFCSVCMCNWFLTLNFLFDSPLHEDIQTLISLHSSFNSFLVWNQLYKIHWFRIKFWHRRRICKRFVSSLLCHFVVCFGSMQYHRYCISFRNHPHFNIYMACSGLWIINCSTCNNSVYFLYYLVSSCFAWKWMNGI